MRSQGWYGLLFVCLSISLAAQQDIRIKQFNVRNGVALDGYDPVSYFDGKPVEGKTEHRLSYQGITYLFTSAEHLARFRDNPTRYEPAYGGWCAYAMGNDGDKVKVDPETYKIVNGKLCLFYNFWGNNTLTDWNKNEMELMVDADRNWSKYLQK